MPIHLRILPQVLHMSEIGILYFLLFTEMPVYIIFPFSSVAYVSYFLCILETILKFSKNY